MSKSFIPFIPEEELAELTAGSFQQITLSLAEAVRDNMGLFGKGPAHLIAVFPTHGIVLDESGIAFEAPYETDAHGEVTILDAIPLTVTVVTESNLRRYVQSEAKEAARLFLQGMTDRANSKIASLASLVDKSVTASDEEIVSSFTESRKEASLWKDILKESSNEMSAFLAESAPQTSLAPKFRKLTDGTVPPEDFPKYKTLVQHDMAVLVSRLDAVAANARAAFQASSLALESASTDESATLSALKNFASDLLADVIRVRDFVAEATEQFPRVDLIAQLFDSIAAEVASFEVAGAFAAKTATRLA